MNEWLTRLERTSDRVKLILTLMTLEIVMLFSVTLVGFMHTNAHLDRVEEAVATLPDTMNANLRDLAESIRASMPTIPLQPQSKSTDRP